MCQFDGYTIIFLSKRLKMQKADGVPRNLASFFSSKHLLKEYLTRLRFEVFSLERLETLVYILAPTPSI